MSGKIIEVWQDRIFASTPDEAAMKIRDACGCGEGKLVLWMATLPGWYEYKVEFRRDGQ